MSEYSITVEGGTSKRLLTAGKYCDRDIVVTATGGGGGGDFDAFLDGSITEVTSGIPVVGDYALTQKRMLEKVNFPNATEIGEYAFQYCMKLKEVVMPKLTTVGDYAFNGCSVLESMDMSLLESVGEHSFENCKQLKAAILPKFANNLPRYAFSNCMMMTECQIYQCTKIGNYAFGSCYRLKEIYLPSVSSIDENGFYTCASMTAVVLSNTDAVVTLANTNAFSGCYHILGTKDSAYNPSALKDGYFYVPAALIEDYKVATNWSTYATQFRALEDYTVDGTVTGKLDESKL